MQSMSTPSKAKRKLRDVYRLHRVDSETRQQYVTVNLIDFCTTCKSVYYACTLGKEKWCPDWGSKGDHGQAS